jgi:hypothetical protein
MNLAGISPPADTPGAGARIPGVAVRAAFAITGAVVALVDYGPNGWLAFGIVLAVAAAVAPETLIAWLLILFLVAGQLARHADLTWRFLALLAGLHLLHVLASLALELPWRSWIQPAVFIAPLRRFVLIQIPTQLLAVVALLLLAPSHGGHRPLTIAASAVVGGAALAGLAVLLIKPRVADGVVDGVTPSG